MGVGEFNADRLESLVELIETATSEYKRAFVRNVNAWIEFAMENIDVSPQLDEAAKRALNDALRFGEVLFRDVAPSSEIPSIGGGLDALRVAAVGSVRGLQTLLVDALPARAA